MNFYVNFFYDLNFIKKRKSKLEDKKILIVDNDQEVRDILNMMVTGDFPFQL